MQHLLKGPVKGHTNEDKKRKKAQHPTGIELMTSLLRGVCSTTMLQSLLTNMIVSTDPSPKGFCSIELVYFNHAKPVQQLDEVVFVVAAVDFEPLEVADVSLLVLPERHVTHDGRLFQAKNKILQTDPVSFRLDHNCQIAVRDCHIDEV